MSILLLPIHCILHSCSDFVTVVLMWQELGLRNHWKTIDNSCIIMFRQCLYLLLIVFIIICMIIKFVSLA